MSITFPEIDPILISVGPVVIRWYSLAYIAGLFLGIEYIKIIAKNIGSKLSGKDIDSLLVYAVIGVILGGRLGYVLFYSPAYYLSNIGDILKVWEGGMSFHGGLVGVIFATLLFARNKKTSFLNVMDMVACASPIGLLFGRIANFINSELYGRTTDVAWGVVFPNTNGIPRHPSQIYEAGLEGLLAFIVLWLVSKNTRAIEYRGVLSGIFLIIYSSSRMFVELFREPDAHLGFIISDITMGQILSIPMLLLGWYLLISRGFRRHEP
jgi:phosphatidylglycerol:prolipoprotein diacylglycerol transferase